MALCPPEAVARLIAPLHKEICVCAFPARHSQSMGTKAVNLRPGRMGAIMPGGTIPGVVRSHGRGTRQPTHASAISLLNAADGTSGVFRTTE